MIAAPMLEELVRRNPQLEQDLLCDIPVGRVGKPEEIADAVTWLFIPQASFFHGHALVLEDGFTIH